MRITKYKTLLNEYGLCDIVKENAVNYPVENNLNSPEKIYKMLCDVFQHNRQTEEYLYLLCLDTKCKLQGIFEISHGTVNMSVLQPREIFQKALLCNATNIILAHNHPSGDVNPSQEDIKATKRILEAGNIIGINMTDYIIVGDSYYSFKEHDLIK